MIALSELEADEARSVGRARFGYCRDAHYIPDGPSFDVILERDIQAALAEAWAAKQLGLPWTGKRGFDARRSGDVGDGIEIRHCSSRLSLIVKDGDQPERPYVLVTGTYPDFRIEGWMLGSEAMHDQFYREDVPRPAWFVHHTQLHNIEELRT